MDDNLISLKKKESFRSVTENYDDELLYLKIQIEYPIQFERFQANNTVYIFNIL